MLSIEHKRLVIITMMIEMTSVYYLYYTTLYYTTSNATRNKVVIEVVSNVSYLIALVLCFVPISPTDC